MSGIANISEKSSQTQLQKSPTNQFDEFAVCVSYDTLLKENETQKVKQPAPF